MKQYVRQRLDIPKKEKTLPIAEQTGREKMFETLKAKMLKSEKRQDYENSWIRPGTWVLVDQRVTFCKEGRLTMAKGRRLNRQIKAALKADRAEWTRRAGEAPMGSLMSGNVKEAWRILQDWYREPG